MEKMKDLLTVKNLAITAGVLSVLVVISSFALSSSSNEKQEPQAPAPTTQEAPAPEPIEEPEPRVIEEPTTEIYYEDCQAVWDNLGRPITSGDEGFPQENPNRFDLDSDGIGCEDNPATPEDEGDIDWKAIWEQTKGNAEEFGDWAGPKLKELWSEVAPGVSNTWEQIKSNW